MMKADSLVSMQQALEGEVPEKTLRSANYL